MERVPSYRPAALEAIATARRIERRISPARGMPVAEPLTCRCGRPAAVRCRVEGRVWLACDNPAHHDGATVEPI